MNTPQSAILPDHCLAAIYIEADAREGSEAALRQASVKALAAL